MTPIVGLLPVSARRMYVYWEAPRRFHGRLTLHARPGLTLRGLASRGGCFVDSEGGAAVAELHCGGAVLASSGAVETPAEAPAEVVEASW